MNTTINKLYDFQAEDCQRMNDMTHVLLFSEMGTGKTIITITHIQENKLKPALILCPRSLKLNWYDEILKWTGEDAFVANTANEVVEEYFDNIESESRKKYYILHHEALAFIEGDKIRELISKISWRSLVVDESQRLRNVNTYRTKALFQFHTRKENQMVYPKLMFLSGTPIVNSTFDIYYILKMLGLEDKPGRFMEKYTVGYQGNWGYKVIGSKNTSKLLENLSPYYIRRTKEEVLKDLPEKQEILTKLEMPEQQRKIYNSFEEMLCIELDAGKTLSSPSILSLFTRLRQLSLDPSILGKKSDSSKTRAVQELIEQDSKGKWVVASTSKVYTYYLANLIKNSLTFTGDDSLQERHNKIKSFTDDPRYRILILTMQTGALGINLQVASNIICTDYWWNKAIMSQQIDRLHRIGQKNRVLIYILHNKASIDDFMAEKCNEKEEMVNEVVVRQDTIKEIYKRRRGYEYEEPKSGEWESD